MKPSLLLVLILLSVPCLSQKQYNVWCFGNRAMLDFNSTPVSGTGLCALFQTEGCASISNANGQLLFYSDGVKVWNKLHQQMPNGFGLLGGFSASQSALIIPLPGSTTLYYIFTAPMQILADPVCYSIVDMSLNGGKGDVTTKNVPLTTAPGLMTEKLTATLKGDGTGYWVLSQAQNGRFDVYSFTAAGVNPVPIVSQAGLPSVSALIGYARISPDGSKLVISHAFDYFAVSLFDFNNNTGVVSNAITLPFTIDNRAYGVEFSPDNSKLYVQTYEQGMLFQFNLLAGSPVDIQNSRIVIADAVTPFEGGGALMRGPDNKIYVARIDRNYVGVIDKPNLLGIACNYVPQAITLAGSCAFGFPNNINYPVCPVALVVNNSITICSNQTYQLPSGAVVSIPGTYHDTARNLNRCDSIITTLNLSVFHVTNVNTSAQICPDQPYQLPSGTIVTAPGMYKDTIRSVGLCDSIITTVNLSIFSVTNVNTSVEVCFQQSYQLPSGVIVNSSGIYQDTIRSAGLCDSIIYTIDVEVNDLSSSNFIDSVYEGELYVLPSGQTVYAPGIYHVTLTDHFGCDSIITVTLKQKIKTPDCITLKNAFTPNGDGINEYWVLYRYRCFKKMELNVYNRDGILVYHADDYKNDWNGTYRNKPVPDGTYYYIINLLSFDSHKSFYKGDVTVFR